MKERGQLQLEAMVCFALFLALLLLFLGSINQAAAKASQALDALKAKAETELCCLAADTVYANNISQFFSDRINCTALGSSVQSEVSGKRKESICLAEEIRLVQQGERSVLEVNLSEHYR